jgi:hypothetical protein
MRDVEKANYLESRRIRRERPSGEVIRDLKLPALPVGELAGGALQLQRAAGHVGNTGRDLYKNLHMKSIISFSFPPTSSSLVSISIWVMVPDWLRFSNFATSACARRESLRTDFAFRRWSSPLLFLPFFAAMFVLLVC